MIALPYTFPGVVCEENIKYRSKKKYWRHVPVSCMQTALAVDMAPSPSRSGNLLSSNVSPDVSPEYIDVMPTGHCPCKVYIFNIASIFCASDHRPQHPCNVANTLSALNRDCRTGWACIRDRKKSERLKVFFMKVFSSTSWWKKKLLISCWRKIMHGICYNCLAQRLDYSYNCSSRVMVLKIWNRCYAF